MKKLLSRLIVISLVSGCVQPQSSLKERAVSPMDAILIYLSKLLRQEEPEKIYPLLSEKNRANISLAKFSKNINEQNIFSKSKVLKNTLLDLEEISPTHVRIYTLLVLSSSLFRRHPKQCVVLKFDTVFEEDQWKIHLRYEDLSTLGVFPVFLQLNKFNFTLDDIRMIQKLIKKDKTKPQLKKQLPTEKISHLKKKLPVEPKPEPLINQKLKTLQNCYNLGEELFKKGDYAAAIRQFQKVLALDDESFNAKNYLARCKDELKKKKLAEEKNKTASTKQEEHKTSEPPETKL